MSVNRLLPKPQLEEKLNKHTAFLFYSYTQKLDAHFMSHGFIRKSWMQVFGTFP